MTFQFTRQLGLAALVLSFSLGGAALKADTIFDVSGTVGDIFNTSSPSPYGYTGLTVTGTLTIDTVGGAVDGVDIMVQTDPNDFINILACSSDCTYVVNGSFNEYGLLDLGTSFTGYTGGPLAADSWIYLDTPVSFGGLGLGQGGPGVQYSLSGSLTPETAATPEPRYYTPLLALALLGSFAVIRRRQNA